MAKSSSFDIIALHNIDSEDFTFEYDKSAGNPPYTIPAGQIKRFPRFLAEHALKHLINQILTRKKMRINNEVARQELAAQIVVDEETFQQGSTQTEAEKLNKDIESMNKPSDLEKILKQNRPKEVPQESPQTDTQPKAEEKFEGLEEGEEPLKGDEVDTTEPTAPLPDEEMVAYIPSRGEIYRYAEKQGMVLDPETTKKLDKMKIPQLLKELGDPRDSLT